MIAPIAPRCRTVRSWVSAAYDDELSVEQQVAMDAHLDRCAACRRTRDEVTTLGMALRRGASEHRPDDAALARLAPEVLARMTVEHDASWGRRVRDVVEDGHRLWIVGGALAATMAVTALVATVPSLVTPTHPQSLAGLLQAGSLGSNANPIWLANAATWEGGGGSDDYGIPAGGVAYPDAGNEQACAYRVLVVTHHPPRCAAHFRWLSYNSSLPHVSADTRAAAMLIQPLPALQLDNLALTAVVTREGQLASVEVLREEAPDADLARAISRLASGVQFVPARAAGAPIAVNVVWLLERTTVRGAT